MFRMDSPIVDNTYIVDGRVACNGCHTPSGLVAGTIGVTRGGKRFEKAVGITLRKFVMTFGKSRGKLYLCPECYTMASRPTNGPVG
jgi:hypothetical protein